MPHLYSGDSIRRRFTPPQIAKMFGITPSKVLRWIYSGQLSAIDISTTGKGKPRWLVDLDSLQAFEQRRASDHQPQGDGDLDD